jgi:hypothetical protein
VLARVIGLLLVGFLLIGAVAQVSASPGVTSAVAVAVDDDGDPPALDPAIVPEPICVALPDRREPVSRFAPDPAAPGRLHAVFVFRPPRAVASR